MQEWKEELDILEASTWTEIRLLRHENERLKAVKAEAMKDAGRVAPPRPNTGRMSPPTATEAEARQATVERLSQAEIRALRKENARLREQASPRRFY